MQRLDINFLDASVIDKAKKMAVFHSTKPMQYSELKTRIDMTIEIFQVDFL